MASTAIPTYLLSLAGEHRVASELFKRGVFTAITPGNRKQTDLYVIQATTKRLLRIEVKATQTRRWVTRISQRRTDNPPDFWVLASFEPGIDRLFVLTNQEIETLQREVNNKYLETHPGTDVSRGVDGLNLADVPSDQFENQWEKIIDAAGGAEPRT